MRMSRDAHQRPRRCSAGEVVLMATATRREQLTRTKSRSRERPKPVPFRLERNTRHHHHVPGQRENAREASAKIVSDKPSMQCADKESRASVPFGNGVWVGGFSCHTGYMVWGGGKQMTDQ